MPYFNSFKSTLFKPCKFFSRIKLSFKRPISIQTLKKKLHCHRRRRFQSIKSLFKPFKKYREEMDRVMELKSFNERDQAPFPSPITPAFIKLIEEGEDVDEACKSFENYLVEMIVEEGKVRDLNDVEELLYCWNSLKSPVFVDLVSRFYGELCKDLFLGSNKQYEMLDDSMHE
ncbi:uncharacterized protein A4U43_C07F5590 [Asparagus officinalis]|uniref:OVATE domain-containing protein n=1 Tax=Asparagus officinalis TaxID=4686 RepID=A0A5P1EEV6_ASPOF|nr:transcription repressor OFP17-like [Asparagus officinalis]ONK62580.1 uncharacterized protein A4U43_C07F5590 [Asparagus officinalis]